MLVGAVIGGVTVSLNFVKVTVVVLETPATVDVVINWCM
jgi:hypothetical protein